MNLIIIYGGNSVEHDISIISALQAAKAVDREKYNVYLVYADNSNNLFSGEGLFDIQSYQNKKKDGVYSAQILLIQGKAMLKYHKSMIEIDVALPVVHGQGVEDGTIIGLLDFYNIPHTCASLVGASVGQDKGVMKRLASTCAIKQVPFVELDEDEYFKNQMLAAEIAIELKFPLIVKPANLGSSIGIAKADDLESLNAALLNAFSYDSRVVIEKALINFREVNIAIIGDEKRYLFSDTEEVGNKQMLSFNDKYESGSGMAGLRRQIPANISKVQEDIMKNVAVILFRRLHLMGVARLDFLIDEEENVYFNEINTVPGSLAFYLFEKRGILFDQLIDQMILLALLRKEERLRKKKHFYSQAIKKIGQGRKLF